jgi:hypothetical protein
MTSNIWWIGPVVLVLLRVLYAEARSSRATRAGDVLVFRPALGVRLLLGVVIVGFFVGIVLSIGREELWILIGSAMLVVAMCFAWPSTITVGGDEILRQSWWRPNTRICWTAVTGVEKRAGGEIYVYGSDGQNVTFSRYHVDPRRFEREVIARAHLQGSIDASGPPRLR